MITSYRTPNIDNIWHSSTPFCLSFQDALEFSGKVETLMIMICRILCLMISLAGAKRKRSGNTSKHYVAYGATVALRSWQIGMVSQQDVWKKALMVALLRLYHELGRQVLVALVAEPFDDPDCNAMSYSLSALLFAFGIFTRHFLKSSSLNIQSVLARSSISLYLIRISSTSSDNML